MVDSSNWRDWAERAELDLGAAQMAHAQQPALYAPVICFHCQQSVEKYLKAVLVQARTPYPRTHDLEVLFQAASAVASLPSSVSEAAQRLQPYATAGRYPLARPDAPAAAEALVDAGKCRQACRAALGLNPGDPIPTT